MATTCAPVRSVPHRWTGGPGRLVVVGLLGMAAVVGAITAGDAMSRPRAELAACDRFAAVIADGRYDLVGASGNLDDAMAHSRGTAVEDELRMVRATARTTRAGDGALIDVIVATRRFESACRRSGWDG